VEHIGVEVITIRPHNGAKLEIDTHLAKVARVSKRLSHRTPEVTREVDLANQAIGERQPQPKVLQRLDASNAGKWASGTHGNGSMLVNALSVRLAGD
jgi:hypothetical protein